MTEKTKSSCLVECFNPGPRQNNRPAYPEKKMDKPYNDNRFDLVYTNAVRIKEAIKEINNVLNNRLINILGIYPEDISDVDENKKGVEPDCWISSVIIEQNLSLDILEETLKRLDLF